VIVGCDDNLAAIPVVGEGGAGDLPTVLVHLFIADDQIVGVDGINTVVILIGEGYDRPILPPPATADRIVSRNRSSALRASAGTPAR
jgi:hypothetical protein